MRPSKKYVADFETTVYENQDHTEVWACALVEIGTEDVIIFHSIEEFFAFIWNIPYEKTIYFHNLKFDGQFILSALHKHGFKEAKNPDTTDPNYFKKKRDMEENEYRYTISNRGQWYSIGVEKKGHYTEFLDSLKLLPFSVKQIGKGFQTKHQKLEMEYEGYRYAGCYISEEEKEYIRNDVLVVKEGLEVMFGYGFTKMTIGACCHSEYKKMMTKPVYDFAFPDLCEMECPIEGFDHIDQYIRKSYYGGWCYLKKGCENKIYKKGLTADVNSLYPSCMYANKYPIGKPTFWRGEIPDIAKRDDNYFFVRIRCRFQVKKNYLPFIQVKGTWLYRGTESLETSDIRYGDKYYRFYEEPGTGKVCPARVTLTLTQTDYYRFLEHYNVSELEYLDGCYFETAEGIFWQYIDKYMKIKIENNDNKAKRQWAKLALNNLYGRMAASNDSSFKLAYWDDENEMRFIDKSAHDKKPGYIAVGSAITSYARDFTIRTAQKNYKHFIYADTDSIHCNCKPQDLVDVPVHDTALSHWKLESYWDRAIFVRQKTYIEHVTHEDGEKIENPYYNVKCAGMNDRCKKLFLKSMGEEVDVKDIDANEEQFLKTKRTLTDFKLGLSIPGKLMPKRIDGGVVLVKTTYQMR